MGLIKNEIPILEYDTEKSAVLMPGHSLDHHFTEKAVLLFMQQEQINDYIAVHDCEVTGSFESIVKQFLVYETEISNQGISFVQMPLGGAGAVQIMEQMIAGGSEKFIAVGCCGALVDGAEGDLFPRRQSEDGQACLRHPSVPARVKYLVSSAAGYLTYTNSRT